MYKPIISIIKKTIKASGNNQIIYLGSGGGGDFVFTWHS